jgi:3-oxoacyl-[acyl-carrier-protein] synthase-1/3-oxoacyl-[acyl-carrier-protein] synthase II
MRPVDVLAWAAVSASGRGASAIGAAAVGAAAESALQLDAELARQGISYPFVGRVAEGGLGSCSGDRAERLLAGVARDLVRELETVLPDFRSRRVRVVVGTSSGAMQSIEAALRARENGEDLGSVAPYANYFSPLARLERELDLIGTRPLQVLAACASSTFAIGLGCRWLDADACDLVIAGGYDALSGLVTAGFEALGALTRSRPQPFREARDGMALGEGAGLVALGLSKRFGPRSCGRVLGFGASSDAQHVTAPHPEGRGLAAAAAAALQDAQVDPATIDFISAHATGTVHNDAAEARALSRVFGDRQLLVHALKGSIGHTLGAAGVLESLAAWHAMACGIAPASVGQGPLLESRRLELIATQRAQALGSCLKLSAAFGGFNAALVLSAAGEQGHDAAARPRHCCGLSAVSMQVTALDRELLLRVAPGAERIAARADTLSGLVLAAIAQLVSVLGEPLASDTALVVGSTSATLEADERFDLRRRAGRSVEPKRFPFTSPNVCAGLASIAFGLRGPALSVGVEGASAWDALSLAADLVAGGDAPAAVVVSAEDSGPVVRELFTAGGLSIPAAGARAVLIGRGASRCLDRERLSHAGRELGLAALIEEVFGPMAAVPRVGHPT